MKHKPGLDLIRASAIVGVVACHVAALSGDKFNIAGPLGEGSVALFFALSGYLIGNILIPLTQTPSLKLWTRFMCRRWCRTLPLYFVVFTCLALFDPPGTSSLVRHAFFLQTWSSQDYTSQWFGVSWSLAVEEWGYLLASITLLAASYTFGKRTIWPVLIGLVALPLAGRYLSGYPHERLHHDALLRIDGIGWGLVLAQLENCASTLFRKPATAGIVGFLLMIIALMSQINPIQPTLIAIGCCGLLVASLQMRKSLPFIRSIAARSYPIYLVHGPILITATHKLGPDIGLSLGLVLSVGAAWSAHKWIEMPALRLRPSATGKGFRETNNQFPIDHFSLSDKNRVRRVLGESN